MSKYKILAVVGLIVALGLGYYFWKESQFGKPKSKDDMHLANTCLSLVQKKQNDVVIEGVDQEFPPKFYYNKNNFNELTVYMFLDWFGDMDVVRYNGKLNIVLSAECEFDKSNSTVIVKLEKKKIYFGAY